MTNIRIHTCEHWADAFKFCGYCGDRLRQSGYSQDGVYISCGFHYLVEVIQCDLTDDCPAELEIE